MLVESKYKYSKKRVMVTDFINGLKNEVKKLENENKEFIMNVKLNIPSVPNNTPKSPLSPISP
jgi:hypothetical protein